MGTYLLRRIAGSLLVIVGLLVVTFFATHYIGDPITILVDDELSSDVEADRAALRAALGLDDPVPLQFLNFVGRAIQGDFGQSVWQGRPAGQIVTERIPATALLTVTVVLFSFTVATILAVFGARHNGQWQATAINAISSALSSITPFWLALVLIVLFAVRFQWLPTSGYGEPKHLILPVLALSAQPIGALTQILQTRLSSEYQLQYVATARAKGLNERAVVQRHIFRNVAIVGVTLFSGLFAGLVNAAVLAEAIFAWPGLGQVSLQAVQQRDLNVLMAAVFVVGVLVTIVNLGADLLYTVLDPRVRLQ